MIYDYIILATMAFVQNFSNGYNARTRNSADVSHHFKWSLIANSVWFISFAVIMRNIWQSVLNGNLVSLLVVLVIYTVSTSCGSVCAMWWQLKTEEGLRRVGARKDGE